jgi:hypothetical protein
MPASPSSFPEIFTGEVKAGKAYHLFLKSVDWQGGSARLCVAARRPEIHEDAFLKGISRVAKELKEAPGKLDAVIFCPSNQSVLWWEHSSTSAPAADFRFGEVAVEVFATVARRVQAPINLLRAYGGVGLNARGDFVNFQFQRT